MSCLPEILCSTYADGECSPEETRRVESHLIECRACRELVVQLRDEASALVDVLRERERASFRAAPSAVPEPALALGLPVAIGAVAVALAVGGFVLETRLPGGFDLLNPLRLKGAYEMAFDVIFLLRDEAPGLIELLLSLAAVASVSAIGSLVASALYRRVARPLSLGLLAAALLLPAPAARALDWRFDENTHIAAGETVNESLVLSGDEIVIDGVVLGDVAVWGERVAIGGRVEGNVYAFARALDLTGEVTGSVHAVVEDLRVDGEVGGTLLAAAERTAIAERGVVQRDVSVFGESVVLGGRMGRDTILAGDRLEVRGDVARHVEVLHGNHLALRDGARIGGHVEANLRRGEDVELAPGASVTGEITTTHFEHGEHYLSHYKRPGFYLIGLVKFAAAFGFGLLLFALAPRVFPTQTPTTRGFFRSLGVGFVLLVAGPVAIVIAALTLVGIPVAILAAFLYVTALYLAHILVGALLGHVLLRPDSRSFGAFARAYLVGLAIVFAASGIPFLGPAVALVLLVFGLGLLVEQLREIGAPSYA